MKLMSKKKKIMILVSTLIPYVTMANAETLTIEGGATTWGNISSWNSYDQVNINATDNATYAPLQGYGLYNIIGTANNPIFNITTSGYHADAIRQNNAQTQNSTEIPFGELTIGNDLKITATGISADGINMSITNSSIVNIGNSANIETSDGMGIRSNLSKATNAVKNIVNVGSDLVILTHGAGSNDGVTGATDGPNNLGGNDKATGYAVYAGNRDYETELQGDGLNVSYINIGNNSTLTTTGDEAHAVYANKTGTVSLGSTNITTTGKSAHGLYAKDGFVTNVDRTTYAPLTPTSSVPNPTINYNGGIINLEGDTKIIVDQSNDGTAEQSYAIYSSGTGSIISSSNAKGSLDSNIYTITGDIKSDNHGAINLVMNNGSLFNGNTSIDNTSSLALKITGVDSQWNMTKSSSLSSLTLSDAAILNANTNNLTLFGNVNNTSGIINIVGTATNPIAFTIDGDYIGGENQPTDSNQLPANNGTILVNTVWNQDSTQNSTDSLHITGTATGYTEVKTKNGLLGDITLDKATGANEYSNTVITVDTHSLGANSFYGFANTTGAEQALLVQTDSNNYAWKLKSAQDDPITPEKPINPINPKVPAAVLMSKANLNSLYSVIGTLHERVSEQQTKTWHRIEQNDGQVWGRFIGNYNKTEGKNQFDYKSKLWGMQFGYDFNIDYNAESKSRNHSGIMFTYARDNLQFYNNKNVYFNTMVGNYSTKNTKTGHGQSDIYSLGAYNTYYDQNGTYLDLVGMFNYIHNKYTTYGESNDKNHAYGVLFSAEVGKPFAITDNGLDKGEWFIEPQAQLIYQYLKYSNFKTDDIKVAQNHQQGLRGRLGGRLSYNQNTDNSSTKTVYFTANIIQDFLNPKSTDFGTSSVNEKFAKTAGEIGAGVQLPLAKTTYIYFDTRYYHSLGSSNGKTKELSGTFGFKYDF